MNTKKTAQIVCLIAALMMLTSCSAGRYANNSSNDAATDVQSEIGSPEQSETASPEANAGVVLYPSALDIAVDKSIRLAAESDGSQTPEWASSNSSVASVSSNGTVSALKTGESLITVSVGGSKDVCRVTVTESGATLAYPEDPGPVDKNGERVSPDNQEDDFPLMIPDDQDSIEKDLFEEDEYSWQFYIDDKFDTKLTVPNSDISFMTSYHIVLDAHKVGGSTLTGDYEGTMNMEMAIDEESFMKAMKAKGIPAQKMNSAFQVQTINIKFTVVPYNIDECNNAKYAFLSDRSISVAPLVQSVAMAISSANTSASGNIDIQAEEGYGSGTISDEKGKIPFVIEVRPDGEATLSLPRMLLTCQRNWFIGHLVKMRLLK